MGAQSGASTASAREPVGRGASAGSGAGREDTEVAETPPHAKSNTNEGATEVGEERISDISMGPTSASASVLASPSSCG